MISPKLIVASATPCTRFMVLLLGLESSPQYLRQQRMAPVDAVGKESAVMEVRHALIEGRGVVGQSEDGLLGKGQDVERLPEVDPLPDGTAHADRPARGVGSRAVVANDYLEERWLGAEGDERIDPQQLPDSHVEGDHTAEAVCHDADRRGLALPAPKRLELSGNSFLDPIGLPGSVPIEVRPRVADEAADVGHDLFA